MRLVLTTGLVVFVALVTSVRGDGYRWTPNPAIGTSAPKSDNGAPPIILQKGYVSQVGDIASTDSRWPSDKTFWVIPDSEIELHAVRPTGDADQRIWSDDDRKNHCDYFRDNLAPPGEWPVWFTNVGSFEAPKYNVGTFVIWKAPNYEVLPFTITLFDNDDPIDLPEGDTGNRDDSGGGLGSYGNQDNIVIEMCTIETVINLINSETPTTNQTPGPDSRGHLGLWWYTGNGNLWKSDWTEANTDHQPSINNGSATYTGMHVRAVGTGLKTEIYVAIKHIDSLPPMVASYVRDNDNWRIMQEKIGGSVKNRQPVGDYTTNWVPDEDPQTNSSPDAAFDVNDPNHPTRGWLYFGDAPGLKGYRPDADSREGDVVHHGRGYRTWAQIRYMGRWVDVISQNGDMVWGVECELQFHNSVWQITIPARPWLYPE